MTKRSADESVDAQPSDQPVPSKALRTDADADAAQVQEKKELPAPISSFPIGKISAELNHYLEQLYLINQSSKSELLKSLADDDDESNAADGSKRRGRRSKRQWESLNARKKTSEEAPAESFEETSQKQLPDPPAEFSAVPARPSGHKQKVALLMGYSGAGYQGMQINRDVPSIELDLHKALFAAGVIGGFNAMNPDKVSFTRCARTDKGVHAAGQVVSLKIVIDGDDKNDEEETEKNSKSAPSAGVGADDSEVARSARAAVDAEIVSRINAYLPDQIRIYGLVRTVKSFHAKNHCSGRIYEYVLPSYVLKPVDADLYPLSATARKAGLSKENAEKTAIERMQKLDQMRSKTANSSADDQNESAEMNSDKNDANQNESKNDSSRNWSSNVARSIPEHSVADLSALRSYRVPQESLQHLRQILKSYVGTHNFHNYTVGMQPNGKGASRYIMNFECSEPFVREGIEWISLKVKGQSFMLHQIRKMVGLAIMMVRTETPVDFVSKTFGDVRINIPKAPALGLLLEQPLFENFNLQMSGSKGAGRDLVDFEPHSSAMNAFKEKWIYAQQVSEELESGHFADWNRLVDMSAEDFGWFLHADGIILSAAKPQRLFMK